MYTTTLTIGGATRQAKTMKAAFVTEFGKPLTIGQLPVPEPAVLTNVDSSMRLMKEEVFGAILPIQVVGFHSAPPRMGAGEKLVAAVVEGIRLHQSSDGIEK